MRHAIVLIALAAGCGRDGGGDGVVAAEVPDAHDDVRELEVDDAREVEDARELDDGVHVESAPDAVIAVDGGDEVVAGPIDYATCRVAQGDRVPLPEASGVAFLDEAGRRLLVVADSGHEGRALLLDLDALTMSERVLPLGEGAGDDVEGLSRAPDGRIFGLASNGILRAWEEGEDGAFALVHGPIAVSADPAWGCDPFGVNCGANYEGICLDPRGPDAATGCAGWAVSKATGELVCLVVEGAGYRVEPTVRVRVSEADRLSGCAFEPAPPHRVIVAGNLYAYSAIWVVDGAGAPVELVERGAANQEAIAALPGGAIISFGDAQDLLGDWSPRVILACE